MDLLVNILLMSKFYINYRKPDTYGYSGLTIPKRIQQ